MQVIKGHFPSIHCHHWLLTHDPPYDFSREAGSPAFKGNLIFFAVLWLELRAYTLNHSTSPFFVIFKKKIVSHELFA
jgi:hypothetical protein